MTSPRIGGLPCCCAHTCFLKSNLAVRSTALVLLVADTAIRAIFESSRGSAIRFGSGHVRVNAHHVTSRRKLLPSPLSPVIRLTRLANSAAICLAGPTPSRTSLRNTRSLYQRCVTRL